VDNRPGVYSSGGYPAAPDGGSVKFTSKERDSETGLDYFEARYMSAAQGRFTSPDPENAGAFASNPQSWNAYAYVANNPLKYTDPHGLRYQVYDADGKNCADISDAEFEKLRQDSKSLSFGGGFKARFTPGTLLLGLSDLTAPPARVGVASDFTSASDPSVRCQSGNASLRTESSGLLHRCCRSPTAAPRRSL
jgi:RHS repeat-associated protein